MEGKAGKRAAIGGRRHERACGVVVRVKRVDRDLFPDTLSTTEGPCPQNSEHGQQRRPWAAGPNVRHGTEGAEAGGT